MPATGAPPRSPALAAFGSALRAARLRAGLTQAELAGDHYKKAFVSALEHGQSRPSVPALEYLARRLGVGPADLLGEGTAQWDRLEADLALAAGDWQAALDAYDGLLTSETAPQRRAEILRGRAEALSRLGRHREAIPAATEAAAIFEAGNRPADAALARYWQASGLYWLENPREARAVLEAMLAAVRNGLAVEPGFEARVLIALAMVDGREGDAERALTYLHEARGRLAELDDRRRAGFLQSLAISYREAGDLEGALRLGLEALAYFRAAASELDVAVLENELALNFLARGSLRQGEEHAAAARTRLEALGERTVLAHVLETQAGLALAAHDLPRAEERAVAATDLAATIGDAKALVSATITRARIASALGDPSRATELFEAALAQARAHGRQAQVRDCLVALSDLAAAAGDTATALAWAREALGA